MEATTLHGEGDPSKANTSRTTPSSGVHTSSKIETNAGRTGSMKRRPHMSDPENSPQLLCAGRALDWGDPRLDRFELAESTSRVLQVLTTSLKCPGPRSGRSSPQTTMIVQLLRMRQMTFRHLAC